MADITVAEWSVTDMQWWNELAQAWTSFQNGLKAGGYGEERDEP